MVNNGLYIIDDAFFNLVKDDYLRSNKNENRPCYYCLKSEYDKEIYWMIPLSSRIDKYMGIIKSKKLKGKACDGIHIIKMPNDKLSVFLIQDMFPITKEYIKREYTFGNKQLVLVNENDIQTIKKKANRVLSLIKRGKKLTPTSPDIIKILEKLK